MEGSINNFAQMKDFLTISLTEDTDKKGEIQGVFITNDYIEGYWKSGDIIYPMYLIREGSDITPPNKPSLDTMKFDGQWTGEKSAYFSGSKANIKVLFDDLIYYELAAFNGTHFGDLNSFGIVSSNTAKTLFNDTTYDEKKENVVFEFKVKDGSLQLNSNSYGYYCGMGVEFDSIFLRGKIPIDMPTALQIGIVDTKE